MLGSRPRPTSSEISAGWPFIAAQCIGQACEDSRVACLWRIEVKAV